ncbi:MAG TPA: MFS transporter [Actinomycetota bacterium]|nr:MFS transporter [Actinomycetota bacterium]
MWALISNVIPLYPLYALLFAHAGLSQAAISGLFVIWSVCGIACQVPTGVLADRFSRRGALALAGVGQALAFGTWIVRPSYAGFATGFVLWGVSGTLMTGSLQALLYDGLAAAGAADRYARVRGRVTGIELLAQIPAAGAATALFVAGGFALVGWVSVGMCLAWAALALTLPEAPRGDAAGGEFGGEFLATMRAGLGEVGASPDVRRAVIVLAALAGLDAIEEYFALLARAWGIPTVAIPVALLGIPLAGAVGAWWAGRASPERWGAAWPLGLGAVILGAAGVLHVAWGLAGVAAFYFLYRLVLVLADARLQDVIEGPARATVTSVAGMADEVSVIAVFAAWALGGVVLVALVILAVSVLLRRRPQALRQSQ